MKNPGFLLAATVTARRDLWMRGATSGVRMQLETDFRSAKEKIQRALRRGNGTAREDALAPEPDFGDT
jgi:hypothetical protein